MKLYLVLITTLGILNTSCKKFLDAKSDSALTVPSTLDDAQALLDRNSVMNTASPFIGEGSADDYYLTDVDFSALTSDNHKANYTWADELFFNTYPNDWSNVYSAIYVTQLCLETINKIPRTPQNQIMWDDVKGQALFHRARLYHIASVLWAKAYDPAYSNVALGIPLRMATDFNYPSTRATLEESYRQIEKDLTEATKLLQNVPAHPMRGSRPAAFALLSRVYLSMSEFAKAKIFADSSLNIKNDLLDFNTVSAAATFPIQPYNKEVLFVSYYGAPSHLNNTRAFIDSNLMNTYATNDLRRTVYFKDNGNKRFTFKGSYNGSSQLFTGLTTGEILLNRAECAARSGDATTALNDLNNLLAKRFKTGTYTPLKGLTSEQALSLILVERRKELVLRDLRWMDVKRLNKEAQFATTLTRRVNGQIIQLAPGSPRYALPIPDVIIQQTGMKQNER
jgi:tetratricopeptide (TPR) repeat protein